MTDSVESTLFNRFPAGGKPGVRLAVKRLFDASTAVKLKAREADPNRTQYGRAHEVLAPLVGKEILPALARGRRQFNEANARLNASRSALHEKAIGKRRDTDFVWAERIWKMPPGERAAFILKTQAARQVALREPELCDVSKDVFDHALRREIQENHEKEGSQVEVDEIAVGMLKQAINVLEQTIIAAPFVTENLIHFDRANGPAFPKPTAGNVRPLLSIHELDAMVATTLPTAPREATPSEKAELDMAEAA